MKIIQTAIYPCGTSISYIMHTFFFYGWHKANIHKCPTHGYFCKKVN